MGLFNFIASLSGILASDEEEKNKQLEQEMAWNNLDDYEKEEVRKGNYDVYNFEDGEDVDLDEDDYYDEDDR